MLAENGLIERRPRHGYRVRLLGFREINELYEFRLAIEEFVVRRLCESGIEESRVADMVAYWSGLQEGLPNSAALVPAADEEFHEALSQTLGNRVLAEALKDIDRRIHFVRLSDITSLERAEATCTQHIELLRAIASGGIDSAIDSLRRNIEGGRASAESAIKEALAHAYRHRD